MAVARRRAVASHHPRWLLCPTRYSAMSNRASPPDNSGRRHWKVALDEVQLQLLRGADTLLIMKLPSLCARSRRPRAAPTSTNTKRTMPTFHARPSAGPVGSHAALSKMYMLLSLTPRSLTAIQVQAPPRRPPPETRPRTVGPPADCAAWRDSRPVCTRPAPGPAQSRVLLAKLAVPGHLQCTSLSRLTHVVGSAVPCTLSILRYT